MHVHYLHKENGRNTGTIVCQVSPNCQCLWTNDQDYNKNITQGVNGVNWLANKRRIKIRRDTQELLPTVVNFKQTIGNFLCSTSLTPVSNSSSVVCDWGLSFSLWNCPFAIYNDWFNRAMVLIHISVHIMLHFLQNNLITSH